MKLTEQIARVLELAELNKGKLVAVSIEPDIIRQLQSVITAQGEALEAIVSCPPSSYEDIAREAIAHTKEVMGE